MARKSGAGAKFKARTDSDSNNVLWGASKMRATKVTVSLALDRHVVDAIKKQADEMEQSFNARVNAILQKYVNFFVSVEADRAAIIPKSLHQFFVDEIDEEKYAAQLNQMGTDVIHAMFVRTGLAKTLDNFVRFTFEGLCVNGGSIRSVRKYVDEEDGKTCLYFTHDYGLKWSRILSAAFANHIQTALNYHTTTKVFREGFVIKILEKDPT